MRGDEQADELRTAVERLHEAATRYRRYQGGENPFQIWGGGYCSTSSWADMRALGEAYLAEHPADDAEPVTAEWLRSVGFQDRGTWWFIATPPGEVYCYRDRTDGKMIFKYEACDDEDGGAAPLPPMPTRGHVLRLLVALGLPAA